MTKEESETIREPMDSLFSREQLQSDSNEPWWQKNFLITRPLLFGTWDGVFTTVLVNIFGVIVFLRMGWIVGVGGIVNAVILLIICTSLALISVFSAIGICERCQIQSGGIYFLVSHILGGQIGGAVGLMYAFGQSVATALVVIGFGESVARFFGIENSSIHKFIATAALLALTGINMIGVRWVIRLQLILLAFLMLAVVDFYIGALFKIDVEHGVGQFSVARFDANMNPMYDGVNCSQLGFDVQQIHQNFFTVFGVFFANFLGVLAGVNMSDDLRNPRLSIPVGELSAIAVSSMIILSFILLLGSLVNRANLICDTLIAEKVSFTGFLYLTGLYVSSLSSTVGTLLGTPRVIQSIASEGIIPLLNPLAVGHGANKSPLRASLLMMLIAIIFVLLDDLNQLAILSTMPFLITYAFVNYSYVSLAMSYDLQTVNQMTATTKYGSMGQLKDGTDNREEAATDLRKLFPERSSRELPNEEEGSGSIISQPHTWYSIFSNRYISLIGAITNIIIILFINLWYALLHLLALAALYYYIGRVCPSVSPGISQFSLPHMFKTAFSNIEAMNTIHFTQVVTAENIDNSPDVETTVTTLNEENPDYSNRKRYHYTEQTEPVISNLH
uniref:Solute carrier family 12 member 9 n=1 Tax=Elaeophora elaphi TaxID=1147741 RepID=A0A0R3S2F0_9BILA